MSDTDPSLPSADAAVISPDQVTAPVAPAAPAPAKPPRKRTTRSQASAAPSGEAPQPSEGGSYVVQRDGTLKRQD